MKGRAAWPYAAPRNLGMRIEANPRYQFCLRIVIYSSTTPKRNTQYPLTISGHKRLKIATSEVLLI